jgi:hypothetical protein
MPCHFAASKPFPTHLRHFAFVLIFAALLLGNAFAQDSTSGSNPTVPNLVKFSGTISGTPAGTAGVIFALYQEQTGGAPLWQEVQTVTVDTGGHYIALLGSSTVSGIPFEVFSSNQARWLGVQVQGQAEQARVLLVSVPYALKAADAQTLGGLPASAFLRADAATVAAATPEATATVDYVNTAAFKAAINPSRAPLDDAGWLSGYLPAFDSSGNLANSALNQLVTSTTTYLGFGTPAPQFNLHFTATVDPAAVTIDGYGAVGINYIGRRADGTLAAPTAVQTGDNLMTMQGRGWFLGVTSGVQSGFSPLSRANMKFFAAEPWTDTKQGAYLTFGTTLKGTASSTSSATERMRITDAGNVGIGTTTPLYPLSVAGVIQSSTGGFIFPDGSTLTTAVNLPSTAAGNTFTGNQTVNGSETVNGPITGNAISPGTDAVYGDARSVAGASGVGGDSDTSFGVFGDTLNPAPGAAGVLGYTQGKFSTIYSQEAGIASAGLWGDISGSSAVPVAIFGTADAAYAGAFINNSADFPALFAENEGGTGMQVSGSTTGFTASGSDGDGVDGTSSGGGNGVYGLAENLGEEHAGVLGVGNGSSATYALYNIYSGVWGDTGTSSTAISPAWAIGVLGTADDSHAGVFLNNSSSWSTLYISNASTGGTGAVKTSDIFATLKASTSTGTCGIGGNGDLTCTGQVKTLATTGGGSRTVETYSMQSPENWMEDFGSGTLARGAAVVQIDPAFAETVSETADYHVFITPNGDSKGLYVTHKTATSFEVHESGGGTASMSFDYRIVAKRRGFEAQRMADVTERFAAEQQGLNPRAKARVTAASSRPAPSPLMPKTSPSPSRRAVPGKQLITAKPLATVTHP